MITASNCISKLAQSRPQSASPNSLDHGLQVHLSTRSITACKYISKLARLRPPNVSPDSLDYSLQVRTITASNCISKLAQSRPRNASPNSLDHGLQVHLSTRLITASKYIVNERRRVYGDTGETEVDWATGSTYSGDSAVDRHHLIFISSGSTQLRGLSRPGSIISSHFHPRLLELEWFFLTNSVVARLTVCIYIEILKYCMPYYEVANIVTVTKTNMIDEMPCAYGTWRTTALRIRHQVSRRAAQRS